MRVDEAGDGQHARRVENRSLGGCPVQDPRVGSAASVQRKNAAFGQLDIGRLRSPPTIVNET